MTDFSKNRKPWTKEEEDLLLKEYNEDQLTLIDLVINHKRKPRSIFDRLKKLNVIKFPTEVRGYSEYTDSEIYKQLKKTVKKKDEIVIDKTEDLQIEKINLNDPEALAEMHRDIKKILTILERVFRV